MKLFQCGLMNPCRLVVVCVAVATASAGCTGGIGQGGGSDDGPLDDDQSAPDDDSPAPPFVGEKPSECMQGDQDVPAVPLRRLSADEIERSLEVALEVDELGEPLPVGVRAPEGFRNDVQVLLTSQQFVQSIDVWADKVGARARASTKALAGCEAFGEPCEKRFTQELGRRLLRHPLDEGQVSRFQSLFKVAKDQGDDFGTGATLVLRAMISSPQFLYRLEPAPDSGPARKLDGYELATRLSFLAWGAGPDADLLDAAQRGELDRAAGLTSQFERLMKHPRAKKGLRTFVSEWLGLDLIADTARDESKVPLSAELRNDMVQESLQLFEHFLDDRDTAAWELAVAPFTFTSRRLAQYSGVDATNATDAFGRVELPNDQPRLGFLTHAGFLMAHAGADIPKVVERGLTIFKTILCQSPAAPGPNVNTALNQQPLGPGVTERMNAEARAENGTCRACHSGFDPLAFPFERFDGTGRWVERDGNDNALRTDGTMLWMGSPDVEEQRPYQGHRDFLKLLSEDVRFRSCLSQKVTQYAWGRGLEPDGKDACPVYNIRARAAKNGNSLYALFAAVVEDPQFRMVRAAQ